MWEPSLSEWCHLPRSCCHVLVWVLGWLPGARLWGQHWRMCQPALSKWREVHRWGEQVGFLIIQKLCKRERFRSIPSFSDWSFWVKFSSFLLQTSTFLLDQLSCVRHSLERRSQTQTLQKTETSSHTTQVSANTLTEQKNSGGCLGKHKYFYPSGSTPGEYWSVDEWVTIWAG